jgi:hypothetical protein
MWRLLCRSCRREVDGLNVSKCEQLQKSLHHLRLKVCNLRCDMDNPLAIYLHDHLAGIYENHLRKNLAIMAVSRYLLTVGREDGL